MVTRLRDKLTDDELAAVAFKIREAGDLATAINEGFGLQRELPPEDLTIGQNAAALVHLMFSDELDALEDALSRAADYLDLPPLVQTFLTMAVFWPRHERIRRHDKNYAARVDANGGHLVGLTSEECRAGDVEWYSYCACIGETDDTMAHRSTRDEALADLTAHMFEYGLTESAIDHVETEEDAT